VAEERRKRLLLTTLIVGATGCGCFMVLALGTIVAAILLPVFNQAREKARTAQCLTHLKQLALATAQYAADYGTLPPARYWTVALSPYLASPSVFLCPSARQLECGYAFYQPVGGRQLKSIQQPSTTPLLFDSSRGLRNHADKGESIAFRHSNGACIAFVDGHVRRLPAAKATKVFLPKQ